MGLGFLDKYSMYLWLPSCLIFLLMDRDSRPLLRSVWPWIMVAIALAMSAPVIVWNAQHDWVSLAHVASQTGTNETGGLWRGNTLEFVVSQIGIVNPPLFVIMAGAVVYAMARRSDPYRRQMKFLLCIGLPFLVICLLDSLRTKVQANWACAGVFHAAGSDGLFSCHATWEPSAVEAVARMGIRGDCVRVGGAAARARHGFFLSDRRVVKPYIPSILSNPAGELRSDAQTSRGQRPLRGKRVV